MALANAPRVHGTVATTRRMREMVISPARMISFADGVQFGESQHDPRPKPMHPRLDRSLDARVHARQRLTDHAART